MAVISELAGFTGFVAVLSYRVRVASLLQPYTYLRPSGVRESVAGRVLALVKAAAAWLLKRDGSLLGAAGW